MTQKDEDEGRTGSPEDIEDDHLGEQDEQPRDEESTDGLEPGANPDAEAMLVSLKKSTHGDDDCVEVYAHGEAYPEDGTEKNPRTVLPV